MSNVPMPKQCEILPPVRRSTPSRALRMADRERDWSAGEEALRRRRQSRPRFLTIFVVGIVAAAAWQSYGQEAQAFIAGLSPQLQWLAPHTTDADADRIGQITRSIERIASDIAAGQAQITHSIDNLAAGQEQITTEIIRLRAITQFAPPKAAPDAPSHRRVSQTR